MPHQISPSGSSILTGEHRNMVMSFLLCVALTAITGCSSESAQKEHEEEDSDNIPIVDTHIHLYDLERLPGLPWPDKDDKVLYRSVLAAEYNQVIAKNHLAGAIVVEASPRVSDNDWILYHTQPYQDQFVGLVGALEFDKETFKDDLSRLCQNERFLGLRIGTQYLDQAYDENYIKHPTVLKNIQRLSDEGKTLDVLFVNLNINDAIFISQNYPKLRIVINNIDSIITAGSKGGTEPDEAIKAIAKNPNVYCKVTSLIHQCTVIPVEKDKPYFKEKLELVLNEFGEDRLVYGSNWPCIIKDGEFSDHLNEINTYFAPRGHHFLEKLFYKNAEKAYGFKLK